MVTKITSATKSEYRCTHSIKCCNCQFEHSFRPAGGQHGKQSRDISTPVFNGRLFKFIESNVSQVQTIMGKHSTSLCSFKGRLLELLSAKTNKLELAPGKVKVLAALTAFSR